ncbi:liver-expressed antimicrobial peptide 2 [Pelodiscus sinensis]|uniref:Liver-expressed antimicrobial peptide 2 n=1 Tax=Pelodiscus sinensis TaxID=13735 RepID=A0A1D6V9F0_PELSI|nr:liver-expressed antimicrobial peptide 2 [Pelodiscus sinensis]AGN03876.1 liver-expressed antimicrobial peptide 2-like protein [Pelodiscus sinensis]QGZ18962.1 liver-expressed antimicrobial peptide 2 [Pelodiscus sinensis]|eukprot:XP_025043237.1 liver-expressed antimicrobial peptide 2 [Pelodiscus sinensis]
MQCLKVIALLLFCAALLTQTHCASLHHSSSQLTRQRRMTPFWRGISLRPIGALCRHDNECISMLCRKNRCSLRISCE